VLLFHRVPLSVSGRRPSLSLRAATATSFVLVAAALVSCSALLGLGDFPPPEGDNPVPSPQGCAVASAACGAHGTCSNAAAAATCTCDHGYAGPTCDQCEPDYAKIGAECHQRCGAVTCPLHARCDAAKNACACATGYVLDGDHCAWRGGPQDPGFTGMPAAWTYPAGGDFGRPAGAPLVDPGVLTVPPGEVAQTFDMPSLADAEPLALDLFLKSACTSCSDAAPYEMGIGGTFQSAFAGPARYVAATGFWHQHLCLGEGAYGVATRLVLGGTLDSSGYLFDRAAYVPDPLCPKPGQVFNGDFEAAEGWAASDGAVIMAGAGAAGTRGASFVGDGSMCLPTVTGNVSIPKSIARPALALSLRGETGKSVDVVLGDRPFAFVTATGTPRSEILCLLPWARGLATSLAVRSSCAAVGTVDVDDLRVVDEPTCPLDANLLDPGFENRLPATAWSSYRSASGGNGGVVHDGADGRTGTGYLEMIGASSCSGSITQEILVPPATPGGAGPAVHLWAKGVGSATLVVNGTKLDVGSAYASFKACLPAARASRRHTLEMMITARSGATTCYGTVDVDDVELTTDAACPAR
jgi:hypothetical protein